MKESKQGAHQQNSKYLPSQESKNLFEIFFWKCLVLGTISKKDHVSSVQIQRDFNKVRQPPNRPTAAFIHSAL